MSSLNLGKGRSTRGSTPSKEKPAERTLSGPRGGKAPKASEPEDDEAQEESEAPDDSSSGDEAPEEAPADEATAAAEAEAKPAKRTLGSKSPAKADAKPKSSLARGKRAGDEPAKAKPSRPAEPGSVPSFMKRGGAAKGDMKRAEVRAKERQDAAKSLWRFWMKPGEERRITFLDGGLDADGMLDIGYFYEHVVPDGGKFTNVMCTLKNDDPTTGRSAACPICEAGDEPSYVGAFTVLDWEAHEDRDGNAHEYRRRLYVPKFATLKKLQTKATKLAEKEGTDGLVGATFDLTRSSDRAANVGDDFELVETRTIEELQELLEKPEHALPADYGQESELRWRTPEEIEDMGLAPRRDRGFGAKGNAPKKARNSDAGRHL